MALALKVTVRELRSRMDSAELSSWLAYDQLDQVPDEVLIGARICAAVYNCMSTGRRFTADDFTYRLRPKPRILSGESGRAFFRGLSESQAARAAR